jgi:metal-sulfur cluster biosynthetic enzyme
MSTKTIEQRIEDQLLTVYDPEFPVVDIWTLGLIRDFTIDEDKRHVHFLMTFTTPACPMGEMIQQMVDNAIIEELIGRTTSIELTFDPLRSPKDIKDEDLQKMFG